MKRSSVQLPVWCLVVVMSLLITAGWLTLTLTSDDRGAVVGVSGDGSPLFQDWKAYRIDGSLVGHSTNDAAVMWTTKNES